MARLHHRGPAIEIDEEIMGVAGQRQIDQFAIENLVTLLAGDVGDYDHEIGALAAQRFGLLLQRRDR